ncbi:MAG: DCN1-like protein 5-like protein [Linnemannia elongata]|nr:MAG: DCN1-like protein 5-like protein [Linnemannia elongata]
MGNKHSTSKDNGIKTRGARVDTTTSGNSFHSTSKHVRLESREITSKPAYKPTTITAVVPPKPTPPVVISPKIFDPEKCYLWFKTYTGLEDDEDFDREQIGPAGIAKLCEDIDVSLETVDMLVLAYHLELKDPVHFKEFYRYIFMFAKDSEQKCMPVDTACAMISTVMKDRPHEQRFVEYLGAKKPIKVINKDQWYNFLDFSDTISEDLSNYDGLSSAWPVLLDEYVEWRNEEPA